MCAVSYQWKFIIFFLPASLLFFHSVSSLYSRLSIGFSVASIAKRWKFIINHISFGVLHFEYIVLFWWMFVYENQMLLSCCSKVYLYHLTPGDWHLFSIFAHSVINIDVLKIIQFYVLACNKLSPAIRFRVRFEVCHEQMKTNRIKIE